tara:strand:- start:3851 stop:4165 length:315 start_codon:yes stop_codon:yes gene_type:complete
MQNELEGLRLHAWYLALLVVDVTVIRPSTTAKSITAVTGWFDFVTHETTACDARLMIEAISDSDKTNDEISRLVSHSLLVVSISSLSKTILLPKARTNIKDMRN